MALLFSDVNFLGFVTVFAVLGLFFGMVVVCAIFFGLGYSMGKNATPAGSLVGESTPGVVQAGPKPTAARPAASESPAEPAAGTATPSQADLTFFPAHSSGLRFLIELIHRIDDRAD